MTMKPKPIPWEIPDRPRLKSAFNKNNDLLVHRGNTFFRVGYPRDTLRGISSTEKTRKRASCRSPSIGKITSSHFKPETSCTLLDHMVRAGNGMLWRLNATSGIFKLSFVQNFKRQSDRALKSRHFQPYSSNSWKSLSNEDDRNLSEKHTLQYTRRIAGFQFIKIIINMTMSTSKGFVISAWSSLTLQLSQLKTFLPEKCVVFNGAFPKVLSIVRTRACIGEMFSTSLRL